MATGQGEPAIEALDSSDSAYAEEESFSSYATSLSSYVEDYKWIHGRRFHSYREGAYNFPNDEREQDRLDLFHHLFGLRLDGKLHLAPLQSPGRILDLGTGTGIWAIDIAELYPGAEVIANDLSPIQPKWVPPTLIFEVDDVESEWPTRKPFDFIHGRYLAGSIQDWPKLMQQCFSQTSVGGWAEFQDLHLENYSLDDSIPEKHAVNDLYTYIVEACDEIGRPASPGTKLKGWMQDAGFRNVHETIFKLPLGPWPKDEKERQIGAINMMQMLDGLEAFTINLFTNILGWSPEQVQLFLKDVREDARKRSVHMIHNFHVVYGQRVE